MVDPYQQLQFLRVRGSVSYSAPHTWYRSSVSSCLQARIEQHPLLVHKHKTTFQMRDVLFHPQGSNKRPDLWLGQLHFFSQIFLKLLCHLLTVTFVPILHVLKRKDIVHLYTKNNNNESMYGRKPKSLFQKQEKTVPKISIPDYSFLFAPL